MNKEIWNERIAAYHDVIAANPNLVKEAAIHDLHLNYVTLTPGDKFVSVGSIGINRTGGRRVNMHNEGMLRKLIAAAEGSDIGNGASAKERRAVATKILSLVDAAEKTIA